MSNKRTFHSHEDSGFDTSLDRELDNIMMARRVATHYEDDDDDDIFRPDNHVPGATASYPGGMTVEETYEEEEDLAMIGQSKDDSKSWAVVTSEPYQVFSFPPQSDPLPEDHNFGELLLILSKKDSDHLLIPLQQLSLDEYSQDDIVRLHKVLDIDRNVLKLMNEQQRKEAEHKKKNVARKTADPYNTGQSMISVLPSDHGLSQMAYMPGEFIPAGDYKAMQA